MSKRHSFGIRKFTGITTVAFIFFQTSPNGLAHKRYTPLFLLTIQLFYCIVKNFSATENMGRDRSVADFAVTCSFMHFCTLIKKAHNTYC